MELRYCECEIEHRGPIVALKFTYDQSTIDTLKAALNRQRADYQQQTRKLRYLAGGWLKELRVWYVAPEIWPRVSEELRAKGYLLVQVLSKEAFFGKQTAGQEREQQESHQQIPPKHECYQKDYELLGLTPAATAQEMKQAYHDMVEVWHPDRFAHNERLRQKAEAMMKQINTAYYRLRFATRLSA
jgi:DnaJ-like protein